MLVEGTGSAISNPSHPQPEHTHSFNPLPFPLSNTQFRQSCMHEPRLLPFLQGLLPYLVVQMVEDTDGREVEVAALGPDLKTCEDTVEVW